MNIGLLVVATGKYTRFVPALWRSAMRFFRIQGLLRLFILADKPIDLPGATFLYTPHSPWPGPTLYRPKSILAHRDALTWSDYVFACDADMLFVDYIREEVLGDIVATLHPGFYCSPRSDFTYERDSRSCAYVPQDRGKCYYAGAFHGGERSCYMHALSAVAAGIDLDEQRGLMAIWHDESHWNRYLTDYPPDVTLSPAYCFPEGSTLPFKAKLVALAKDHADLRRDP